MRRPCLRSPGGSSPCGCGSSPLSALDELDETTQLHDIVGMSATTQIHLRRKPARAAERTSARVAVPPGLSAEEARRVLAAVASSAATVARTGRTLTLNLQPAVRKGASRFRIVKSFAAPGSAEDAADEPELSAAARAALRHAYMRGAEAASTLLAGPDMLSSDVMAERLGVSREAVHQKRRRGELLGVEGAKRGVRFPAWQIGPDGRPLAPLRDLHAALGAPWAVFRFLRQRHPELDQQTGLEAAADPRRAANAVALARQVGTYGPAGA